MELYGIAVAILPINEGALTRRVTVTPIAVSSENRQEFQELHDLEFKAEISSVNDLAQCFTKITNTVDKLVQRQKDSCNDAGVDYRPVSLIVGDAEFAPTDRDGVYEALFGNSFTYIRDKPYMQSLQDLTPENLQDFVQACEKMKDLIQECTLASGHYNGPVFFTRSKEPKVFAQQSTELDKELLKLREKINSGQDIDGAAHERIKEIARQEGNHVAIAKVDPRPNEFYMSCPPGYYLDKAKTQLSEGAKQCPRYSYHTWHPDYRNAFYEGIEEKRTGTQYLQIKLPSDRSRPFYADPCADQIRWHFLDMEGKKKNYEQRDNPDAREKILQSCEQIVDIAKHFIPKNYSGVPTDLVQLVAHGPFQYIRGGRYFLNNVTDEGATKIYDNIKKGALVEFLGSKKDEIEAPEFEPSNKQIQLLRKMAGEFGLPDAQTASFEEHYAFLKQIADDWEARDRLSKSSARIIKQHQKPSTPAGGL